MIFPKGEGQGALTLPQPCGRGFFLQPAGLTTHTRVGALEVHCPEALRRSEERPVPACPAVRSQYNPHWKVGAQSDEHERRPAVRQVPRPSCEGSTLPFLLTVCTLKDALMLLLKGATYLETPKHDSVVKVQAAWQTTRKATYSIAQVSKRINMRRGGAASPVRKHGAFALALGKVR